ncbi:hypothetical protein AB1Y20_015695 [Prymnesium parvum]|uniref:Uncharacterized protein n=1 Tax=Prymnesium parvum TaxID=97485 RepID=A0AB34K195_PRYPA|mmetsp:Transcript_34806/g.84592  ORF Transcript_34806/g.84592 Transcript_34806/m.84592 type:complete len:138 (+) Transcript_34806:233-646(+)
MGGAVPTRRRKFERKALSFEGSGTAAPGTRRAQPVVRDQGGDSSTDDGDAAAPPTAQDSSDAEVDDETGAIVVGDADHEAEPQRAPQDVVPLGEWKRDDHCLQIVQVMQMPVLKTLLLASLVEQFEHTINSILLSER